MNPDEEFRTATQNLTEAERTALTQLSYIVQVIPDDVLDEILRVLKLNLMTQAEADASDDAWLAAKEALDPEDEAVVDAALAAIDRGPEAVDPAMGWWGGSERPTKADADETLGDVVAWRSEVFDGSTLLSFTEWQEDRRLLHPRRPENQA